MAVSRKRNVRNRRTNSKERSQSRRFVVLFIILIILSYFTYEITKFQPEQPKIKELTVQDSILIFAKNTADDEGIVDTLNSSLDPKDQIVNLCQKLGVIDELVKFKQKDGQNHVSIAINANLMDLNFANYFFSSQLSKLRWKLNKGEENTAGTIQSLTFISPDQKSSYILNLYYDKSNSYPPLKTKVALIITELGEKKIPNIIDYLKNPYPINYAIIPYRKQSKFFVQLLSTANVELLINIPMEDINYPVVDHGKNAITVKLKDSEIKKCIEDYLLEIPNAKGSINYLGSLASTDETIMKSTMRYLQERNIYFVDNMSSASSVAFNTAQKIVLSSYKKNLNLNFTDKKETIEDKMNKIKGLGASNQLIILTISASELPKASELIKFCEKINKANFELIRLSSLEEEIFF